jgi:hypothetical protein
LYHKHKQTKEQWTDVMPVWYRPAHSSLCDLASSFLLFFVSRVQKTGALIAGCICVLIFLMACQNGVHEKSVERESAWGRKEEESRRDKLLSIDG